MGERVICAFEKADEMGSLFEARPKMQPLSWGSLQILVITKARIFIRDCSDELIPSLVIGVEQLPTGPSIGPMKLL
jgi:hypothetical protein